MALLTWPIAISKRTGAWLLAGLGLTLFEAQAAERPVLTLNDTNEAPYTTAAHDGFLDVVAGEAFRRTGVTLRLTKAPPERGLLNANSGMDDGDMVRIAGLEAQYPNLIRVPEKLIDWDFVAFSRGDTTPSNWADIRQHNVGLIKGWKIYERAMQGAEHVTTTDNPEQLFRLLALGRIEVALYERWLGTALAKQQNLKNVHPLTPSLARREMFIYLNRRHAALAPKLAAALRDLKQEGFYERVYREKLGAYREGRSP